MEPANSELTTKNGINAVQNEPLIREYIANATEGEKHLAWQRIYYLFSVKNEKFSETHQCYLASRNNFQLNFYFSWQG